MNFAEPATYTPYQQISTRHILFNFVHKASLPLPPLGILSKSLPLDKKLLHSSFQFILRVRAGPIPSSETHGKICSPHNQPLGLRGWDGPRTTKTPNGVIPLVRISVVNGRCVCLQGFLARSSPPHADVPRHCRLTHNPSRAPPSRRHPRATDG